MALGFTQLLTEVSTRSISWAKGGRCVRLTTLPPSCAAVMKSGNLNFLEPSGPLHASKRTAFTFYILVNLQHTNHMDMNLEVCTHCFTVKQLVYCHASAEDSPNLVYTI